MLDELLDSMPFIYDYDELEDDADDALQEFFDEVTYYDEDTDEYKITDGYEGTGYVDLFKREYYERVYDGDEPRYRSE